MTKKKKCHICNGPVPNRNRGKLYEIEGSNDKIILHTCKRCKKKKIPYQIRVYDPNKEDVAWNKAFDKIAPIWASYLLNK